MSVKIFSEKGELFLKNDMCICLDDLYSKILTDAEDETKFFKSMIDYYLAIDFPYDPNNDLTYFEKEKNRKIVESKLANFYDDNKLEEDAKAYIIYEEIAHVLRSYSTEGLLGVWYHREASLWYPKIIINKNFGSRDNIKSLDKKVIIYRGTSDEEYNSKQFGQAWSLDKEIAHKFAFSFYKKSPNYINTIRVVIQAEINRDNIFHYRKGHIEKEIVINSKELIPDSIQIIEKGLLKNEE